MLRPRTSSPLAMIARLTDAPAAPGCSIALRTTDRQSGGLNRSEVGVVRLRPENLQLQLLERFERKKKPARRPRETAKAITLVECLRAFVLRVNDDRVHSHGLTSPQCPADRIHQQCLAEAMSLTG